VTFGTPGCACLKKQTTGVPSRWQFFACSLEHFEQPWLTDPFDEDEVLRWMRDGKGPSGRRREPAGRYDLVAPVELAEAA
jgi:hypothetical protein